MIKGDLTGYLILMFMFQIIIILIAVIPLGLSTSFKLNCIVLIDCGLLGATIITLASRRKEAKTDSIN